MHEVAHGPSNGKRGLGDEVMDMPAYPAEDMGDVHVPTDKVLMLLFYMYIYMYIYIYVCVYILRIHI